MAFDPVNISDELHRELGSPTDTTIPEIAFWLRTNLGMLNNLIGTSYNIDDSNTSFFISGDGPNIQEQSIYKELYKCHYYQQQINKNLGSTAYDSVTLVQSDGAIVRKVNKNDVAKTYLQLKKDCGLYLKDLINQHKINKGGGTPLQVAGDDDLSPTSYVYQAGYTREGGPFD